jgi:DNA primase large subunit
LNVFDANLVGVWRPKDEITADNPLGTPADNVAYTLGCDIDKGYGKIEDPEIRRAVEAAASFLVNQLKEKGISKSVWSAFSGGGIYVFIHHEICKPKSSDPSERLEFYKLLTSCYNNLIIHTSEEFFSFYPEHKGKVKFDALNNSKRIFKCIFSIHKSSPYAVVPLDRDNIKIDLRRARVPLCDAVIDEARNWYTSCDPLEREPFLDLLNQYRPTEEQKAVRHFEEVWRSPEKIGQEHFAPCIKYLIETANSGEGKTRFSGILSTYLYQMGWDQDEAWELVERISERNGLDNARHIFESCYGRISCPSCETIQNDAAGYPHLGLNGLNACKLDDKCNRWPGDYSVLSAMDELASTAIAEEELKDLPIAENPILTINLEHDNVIMRYIEYGKATCDAYPEYHYSMVLSLISIATNRNLRLRLKQGDVYPNIWAFNLGKSTIARKSAAKGKGDRFAEDLFHLAALPQSYSPEAMIEELSDKPRSYLFKDEAGAMLAAMQKNYMLEMRDLYCLLYDNQGYSRKLRTGQRKDKHEFNVKDPFVNIWTATTPETFREYTTLLDLTSGWLLRFIYFYPTHKKDWMAFKPLDDEDYTLYAEVLGNLSRIKGMFYHRNTPTDGQLSSDAGYGVINIQLSTEAWQYYQSWQETREGDLQDNATDTIQLALWGRLSFYALKLAMLFTVGRSDYKEGVQINLGHIQEACRQIDEYFLPIGKLVAEEVAREETKNLQNKILGVLSRNSGRLQWTRLLQSLHVSINDVNTAIEALVESEEIEVRTYAKEGRKPVKWICRTKNSNNSKDSKNSMNSKNSSNSNNDTGIPAKKAIFAKDAIFAKNVKDRSAPSKCDWEITVNSGVPIIG